MRKEGRKRKKRVSRDLTLSSVELARATEKHLALAKELVDLARELCSAAWELQEMTRMVSLSPPTAKWTFRIHS